MISWMSRRLSKETAFEPEPVMLSQVIEMAIESVLASAKEKSIDIVYNMDPLIPTTTEIPIVCSRSSGTDLQRRKVHPLKRQSGVLLVKSDSNAVITFGTQGAGSIRVYPFRF